MKRLHSDLPIPTAHEIMNDHVLTFPPELEIEQAVRKLLRRGYSGAPVVDAEGSVLGILSEVDCLRVLTEASYHGWPQGSVADHMTRDLDTTAAHTDLFTLAQRFETGKHRRFPVVDPAGRLIGLVTRHDLLRALDGYRHEQERKRLANTYELIEQRRRQLG